MKAWLSPLARLLAGATSVVAFLLVVALILGGGALYLAARGESIIVVRELARLAGSVIQGQHTDHLRLEVHVDPGQRRLQATAHLEVHALAGPRRRFFFLLNDALTVQGLRVTGADDALLPASLYRFNLLTVVELDAAVAPRQPVHVTLDYTGDPTRAGLVGDAAALGDDRVMLGPDAFWYPFDAQSFFDFEASVTLPSRLRLAANGADLQVIERGTTNEVRWSSERPVPGLALVAGLYDAWEANHHGKRFRLYRAGDIGIDVTPTLDAVSDAESFFTELYGPSGYSTYAIVLDDGIRRAFNDGSGLMVLPTRYFRDGDAGSVTLAHEMAHVWWGGTVAETWLAPSSGGQWIVEGMASGSAALATAESYGDVGGVRARLDLFFDPENQHVVRDMSFLDNALTEGAARDTIYRKGGFATLMLHDKLGRTPFSAGMRQFVDRFRYRQASDADAQAALEEATGTPLDIWFDDWLRGDGLADLGLEATPKGGLAIVNRGTVPIADAVTLALVHADGSVERRSVHVGEIVEPPADLRHAVLDPDLVWADVRRANNRHPGRSDPRYVSTAAGGATVVVDTQGQPWERASVRWLEADGRPLHHWDFERAPIEAARVAPDGKAALVTVSRPGTLLPSIVKLDAQGKRRTIGVGRSPVFLRDGGILTAVDEAVLEHRTDGEARTLLRRPAWQIHRLLPSPDETHLLYVAVRGARQQVRLYTMADGRDELLHESARDRSLLAWSTTSDAAYVVLGQDAGWRLLRLPLVDATPSVVADAMASIVDVEVAPGGVQMALTAAAAPAFPDARHVLYVLDLVSQRVAIIDAPGLDLGDLSWLNDDEVVVVGRVVPTAGDGRLPEERRLLRIRPSSATIRDFP